MNSPLPRASSQPSGAAYQPRSKPSKRRICSMAWRRSWPPTAGVGCSVATTCSRPACGRRRPSISVLRCWTRLRRCIAGVDGTCNWLAHGARPLWMICTTSACSWRFFSQSISACASWASCCGSGSRRMVPASAWVCRRPSCSFTRRSGEAPRKQLCCRRKANRYAEGSLLARRTRVRPGLMAWEYSLITSRASTTFFIGLSRSTSRAWAILLSQHARGRHWSRVCCGGAKVTGGDR
ncbi:hypothetical protein D3C80_1109210 [compost metagenome]